nr:MAG: hypothetical protein [Hangzhou tombus-like virus 1]
MPNSSVLNFSGGAFKEADPLGLGSPMDLGIGLSYRSQDGTAFYYICNSYYLPLDVYYVMHVGGLSMLSNTAFDAAVPAVSTYISNSGIGVVGFMAMTGNYGVNAGVVLRVTLGPGDGFRLTHTRNGTPQGYDGFPYVVHLSATLGVPPVPAPISNTTITGNIIARSTTAAPTRRTNNITFGSIIAETTRKVGMVFVLTGWNTTNNFPSGAASGEIVVPVVLQNQNPYDIFVFFLGRVLQTPTSMTGWRPNGVGFSSYDMNTSTEIYGGGTIFWQGVIGPSGWVRFSGKSDALRLADQFLATVNTPNTIGWTS